MRMDILSAVITLWLIMDPLGNVPVFLAVLKRVPPERRRKVLVREVLIAYVVLIFFMLVGDRALTLLQIKQETISIAGGIVLFLIALRMIFPAPRRLRRGWRGRAAGGAAGDSADRRAVDAGDLAAASSHRRQHVPTVAGDDDRLVGDGCHPDRRAVLLSMLGERGLAAMERLMGMVLVMISVQMFLNGVARFLHDT